MITHFGAVATRWTGSVSVSVVIVHKRCPPAAQGRGNRGFSGQPAHLSPPQEGENAEQDDSCASNAHDNENSSDGPFVLEERGRSATAVCVKSRGLGDYGGDR